MAQKSDSGPRRRRSIGAAAKAEFLVALRGGAARDSAAAAAGYTSEGFYYARRRDAVFRLGWIWALELSAADERAAHKASSLGGPGVRDIEIVPNNKRALQRRRVRAVRFTAERKRLFLAHFSVTADALASAEAAGVHFSTVYKHRRQDAVFAAEWDEELRHAYALLEAEALRQRLATQTRLREARDPAGEAIGEMAQEFERVMKLLARSDRRDGRIGTRERTPAASRVWTFEEAIAALDKRLRSLGLRRGIPFQEDPK